MDRRLLKNALLNLVGYEVYDPEVKRFHDSTARTKIVSAPARTSKSYAGAHELLPHFLPETKDGYACEDILLWIVAPSYQMSKEWDYLTEVLVDRRNQLGFDYKVKTFSNNPAQGSMRLVVEWPKKNPTDKTYRSILETKSATNEQSLQGEEVRAAVMSEAAEQPDRIWTRYLATRVTHCILPTTPKPGAEWIYDMILLCQDDPEAAKRRGIEAFEFPPNANPKYDWERMRIEAEKAASRTATGRADEDPWFAEQFLGKWVFFEGRVLPFRDRVDPLGNPSHVVDRLPEGVESSRSFVSCDYGYDDPAVALLWFVLKDGTLIIRDEVYERHLDPGRFVEAIVEMAEKHDAYPDYYIGDPQRPEVARIMQDHGLPIFTDIERNGLRDRHARSMRLIDALSMDPAVGRPRLFVHRDCASSIREFKLLKRKSGSKDEFAKASFIGDDHAFDAAGYGIQTLPKPRESRRTPDSWLADFERAQRVQAMYQRQARVEAPPMVGRRPSMITGIA